MSIPPHKRSKRTGHKVSRAGREAAVRGDYEARPPVVPSPLVHYEPRRSGRRLDASRVCAFAAALVASNALDSTPWDAARVAGLTTDEAVAALLDLGAGLTWLQDRLVRRLPKSARVSVIVHSVPGYEQARAWPEAPAGVWTVYVVRTYSRLWLGPFVSTATTAREAGVIGRVTSWWPRAADEGGRRIRTPDELTVRGRGRGGNGETETLEDEPGETTWGEGAPCVLDEVAAEHHRSAGTLHGAIALRLTARTFAGPDAAGHFAGCTRRAWTLDELVRAALDLPTGARMLEEDRVSEPELKGWRFDAAKFADEQLARWKGPRPRHARITDHERVRVAAIYDAARATGDEVDMRAFASSLRLSARTLERIVTERDELQRASSTALVPATPAEPPTTLYVPEANTPPPAKSLRLPSGAELPVDALDHLTDSRTDRLARLDAAMRTKG